MNCSLLVSFNAKHTVPKHETSSLSFSIVYDCRYFDVFFLFMWKMNSILKLYLTRIPFLYDFYISIFCKLRLLSRLNPRLFFTVSFSKSDSELFLSFFLYYIDMKNKTNNWTVLFFICKKNNNLFKLMQQTNRKNKPTTRYNCC